MLRQVRQLIVLAAALAGCPKEPAAQTPAPTEGEPWHAELVPIATYTAGTQGAVTARITAKAGFHVNPDYPIAFRPEGHEGVRFSGERLKLEGGQRTPCAQKAEDTCTVALAVPLTPEHAGTGKVAGVLAFSVCSAEKCLIEKAPLALAIDVLAAD